MIVAKEAGMELNQTLVSVGTHGEGQPTKVLLSGIPHFRGRTMGEKREYIQKNFDHLRLALCREPRGHNDQTAAIVTEPVSPGADLRFLTTDTAGHWADMSVSTAMAVVTVACQYGIIGIDGPVSTAKLDTLSGLVSAKVVVRDGRVDSVSIQNVPSFFVRSTTVDVPDLGSVPVDISFCGNFFGFVRASDISIEVLQEKSRRPGAGRADDPRRAECNRVRAASRMALLLPVPLARRQRPVVAQGQHAAGASGPRHALRLDRLQKLLRPIRLRLRQHRPWIAFLYDLALIHENHPCADIRRETHFMGNHQHGPALARQVTHRSQYFAHRLRIQCGRRLIEHQHVRIGRQRARYGDTLLLTA